MTDEIAKKIIEIVARETRRETSEFKLDSRIQDLDIASLDFVQIVFAIEEEFDIYVPPEADSLGQETLQQMVDGVKQLIAANQTGAA